MKRVFSLWLAGVVLMSCFSQSAIYVHYLANRDYYANVLCVNKAKPKINCKGKCRMKAEMAQQEKKDESSPAGSIKNKNEIVYFYQPASAYIESPRYQVSGFYHPLQAATGGYPDAVFHPPAC